MSPVTHKFKTNLLHTSFDWSIQAMWSIPIVHPWPRVHEGKWKKRIIGHQELGQIASQTGPVQKSQQKILAQYVLLPDFTRPWLSHQTIPVGSKCLNALGH